MMGVKELPIDHLVTDGRLQLRAKIDQEHVDSLAETYAAQEDGRTSERIPPVRVLFDSKTYWVWDGNHRVLARAQAGFDTIDCLVEKGTYRDAVLKAAGANHDHGLRRTNQDKRYAVRQLLADKAWGKRSDRWIADACKVSRSIVADVRADLQREDEARKARNAKQVQGLLDQGLGRQVAEQPPAAAESDDCGRIGRDGKTYRTNGRQVATPAPVAEPTTDDDGDEEAFVAAAEREQNALFGRLQDLYAAHLQRRVKLNRQEVELIQAVLDGRKKLVGQIEDQALQVLGLHMATGEARSESVPEPQPPAAGIVYGEAEASAGENYRKRLVEWSQRQFANIDDLTWQVISRQLAALAEECVDWEATS